MLDMLGFDMLHVDRRRGNTVKEFVRHSDLEIICSKVLVAIPQHYVVCYWDRVSDNHKLDVPAYLHPMADEPVNDVWIVKQKPYGLAERLGAIA